VPAFERALELGADALEMDVHLTRDGELVVAHDDTAMRTTGVPNTWAEMDLEEIERLDAGWGFIAKDGSRPFAGHGIRVPRFEDVLAAFPRTQINVDLKAGSVDVALELLRRARAVERVTLASFQLRTLVEVRKRGYEGQTALSQTEVASLLSMPAVLWRQLPLTGTAAQVPTKQGPIRFDRASFVAKCHSLGLRVDYWVIDDRAEAARLLELGADGIMTNDPAAIRPLFATA
jgi:glycerophosphoryl diester phosphodiesterase